MPKMTFSLETQRTAKDLGEANKINYRMRYPTDASTDLALKITLLPVRFEKEHPNACKNHSPPRVA